MKLFNWNDIEDTSFKDALFQNGAALSIGSFDGPHVGHIELFHSVVEAAQNQSLVPGVVTFRQSLGANKSNGMYKGDVSTLEQRLESFKKHGMEFCVVIDFSVEFGKMDGEQFLGILKNVCALKFLAEGVDFRCGYRGRCGKEQIASFASKNGIT
ncbi:MAG: riboflavin biosynthesis protein, partial [Treponema sp.]|nr:riboflavin biosynthesis protein [Treponema sp.]